MDEYGVLDDAGRIVYAGTTLRVFDTKAATWTKFGGNVGAGFEYRFGRWGVRAEGRDYVYKFDRYGFDKTQHEVAWQGGVTVSF